MSAEALSPRQPEPQDAPFLAGDGEMAARMRAHDWSTSPAGPISAWPQSLRTAVSLCLASRHPIEIWWGPEYARFYNDAYRPVLGAAKHPQYLGRPGRECWSEIWDVVGPMLDGVRTTGKATWSEDFPLMLLRNGYLEETYFTFSYAPIWLEDATVGGIFCACAETTSRVLVDRRMRTLRDLGARTAELAARTVEDTGAHLVRTLAANHQDVPFALLYLTAPDGTEARLIAAAGLAEGSPARPERISLLEGADGWPLAEAARAGRQHVTAFPEAFGSLPGGAWPEASREALVLPLGRPGRESLSGFLVVGVSPRRALDGAYSDFFDLAASHISNALSNARLYAEAERQRSRLESLFMQAPAAICVLQGAEHVFDLANERYLELVGRRDIVGKPIRAALPELAEQAIMPVLDGVYRTGEPFFGNEYPVTLERGGALQECFFNFVYQPSYGPDGKVEGILVLAFEVTAQVQARRRVELLSRDLEASNRDLDQFAYAASHDLKAPLRGIASLSEWIEEGLAGQMGEETRQQMRMLRGRVHRLEALINGILSYSRASRVREKVERVDVGLLLHECRELLAPPPEARILIAPGMPVLEAERVLLQQVFLNLMSNALKHAGRADVRIDVAWADAGAFYDFSVKDDGPGIAPEYHERIWGMFQTLEARDKVEGAGIGLSVVKKLVETRGGRASVESEPGAGATFHVYWPKRATASPPASSTY
jgi:nitrogen-specific signal transduction histidine kinase